MRDILGKAQVLLRVSVKKAGSLNGAFFTPNYSLSWGRAPGGTTSLARSISSSSTWPWVPEASQPSPQNKEWLKQMIPERQTQDVPGVGVVGLQPISLMIWIAKHTEYLPITCPWTALLTGFTNLFPWPNQEKKLKTEINTGAELVKKVTYIKHTYIYTGIAE